MKKNSKKKERRIVLKTKKIIDFYKKEFYIEICETNHD